MSLRIWLPLNGDLKNNGINQYEITTINTISWVNGKIGKAVQIGNGNQVTNGISINSNLEDILVGNYSISVWIKPLGNHVHYNGAIISSGDWSNSSAHSKWSFGVSQDNTKVDVLCTGYNTYLNCACPVNEWTHLACVYNGTNVVKLYKNGEYVGQYQNNNFPTQRPTSSASNTTIGRETYANGYFSFNGCINDLRIYDHALSEKEVKKISQGLILHYPLNRNGFGQENLITQAMINADPWKSAIQSEYTVDGITGWILRNYTLYNLTNKGNNNIFTNLTYEENTQYTLSLKWRDDYRTDGKTSALYFRFKYTDGTMSTNLISPKVDYWVDGILTSDIGKSVKSILTTYGNGGDLLIADLKLEKGAKKTPYSPIVNSNEYNMVGLDDNIEYDMSGYKRNAIRYNGITFDSDSPKFNSSTVFNSSSYSYIKCDLTDWMVPMTEMTISCWCYMDNWTQFGQGYGRLWSCTEGGGFNVEWLNSKMEFAVCTSPSGYLPSEAKCGVTLSDLTSGWHLFTYIYTTVGTRLYIDGNLYKSYEISSNYVSYYTGARLFLGCEANVASPYQPYFKGKMSDFRIYATALSQADIAELYSIHRS